MSKTKLNRSPLSNTFERASYPNENQTMATITIKLPKFMQLHYSVEAKKLNKSLSLIIIELLSKKLGEPVEPVPAAAAAAPAAAPAAGGGKKSGGVKTKTSAAGEPENALLFEK
jgi:hypothetical protein